MVVTEEDEAQDKKSTNVTCYMICKNFYLRKCQSGGELGQLVLPQLGSARLQLHFDSFQPFRAQKLSQAVD